MNTHDYEELGDELFQMLCQALLVREFNNVQCYPVGMPDGGRDALTPETHLRGAVVFQVKFCRDPSKIDPVAWICEAVKREEEKVERLVARGAQQYVLMTNVQGTPHLDVGRIDRVQQYLNETLPIPSVCWWRDDLDRRLENAYDLKLRYPAVLRGVDLVRLLWEISAQGDEQGRRRDALNAYMGYHHKEESRVRFRQVELVSTALLDLYIDVPAVPAEMGKKESAKIENAYYEVVRRTALRYRRAVAHEEPDDMVMSPDDYYRISTMRRYRRPVVGGADLLTDPRFVERFPAVVIEGAPGQGKSTLTQYLAQLQRARILDKSQDIPRIPKHHQKAPLAIPIRIELRDLAVWLKGIDPWGEDAEDNRHRKPRSLEGAIAAHIARFSGGIKFDVADLTRILQTTPTLLLLDALDEVPDVDDRAAVVSAVCETLARFEGNQIKPQVVITSRPTAIAGSPTFPSDQFLHLTLAPLDSDLALSYARKWALARGLDLTDRERLPEILMTKMRAPHIEQLARNTMQLSILLSLVQRRGSSLPDKRTELYNAYFEIFLDRESEKSAVIRENRDLLFDIHRFLGFYLHSIAEQEKTSGRITHERLKWLLRDYLTAEQQPHDLINDLLSGMVERFGALVSRVLGQYEFEVQPLQEYFAARHLSDTAPPSPPGRESPGTKAERFDAISRNPYWFNVTRFLGGCFNKGELADLAERVCDLVRSSEQRNRPFARSLCVALLQDWVFSQSPRAAKKVVQTVFDDLGLAWATTGYLDASPSAHQGVVHLPPGGGAEFLAEICWERIVGAKVTERTMSICRLLRRNSDPRTLAARWYSEYLNRDAVARNEWLQIGAHLGVPAALNEAELRTMATDWKAEDGDKLPAFFVVGGANVDHLPEVDPGAVFGSWLNTPSIHRGWMPMPNVNSTLSFVAWVVSPWMWLESLSRPPHRESGWLSYLKIGIERFCQMGSKSPLDRVKRIGLRAVDWHDLRSGYQLRPWVEVVSALDEEFGRTWTSIELGIMAGGIRNSAERGHGASGLFDTSVPLPVRIRYAKRFSADPIWWESQLAEASSEMDVGLWCIATVWTKAMCFLRLAERFEEALSSLSPATREVVLNAIQRASEYAFRAARVAPDMDLVDLGWSAETLAVLSRRFDAGGGIVEHLLDRISSDIVADVCLGWLISSRAESIPAEEWTERIRVVHRGGGTIPLVPNLPGNAKHRREIAQAICQDTWDIPGQLVRAATNIIVRRKMSYVPTLEIAKRERWFEG